MSGKARQSLRKILMPWMARKPQNYAKSGRINGTIEKYTSTTFFNSILWESRILLRASIKWNLNYLTPSWMMSPKTTTFKTDQKSRHPALTPKFSSWRHRKARNSWHSWTEVSTIPRKYSSSSGHQSTILRLRPSTTNAITFKILSSSSAPNSEAQSQVSPTINGVMFQVATF